MIVTCITSIIGIIMCIVVIVYTTCVTIIIITMFDLEESGPPLVEGLVQLQVGQDLHYTII